MSRTWETGAKSESVTTKFVVAAHDANATLDLCMGVTAFGTGGASSDGATRREPDAPIARARRSSSASSRGAAAHRPPTRDHVLVQRWIAGSPRAGAKLLGRHTPALTRFFRTRMPDATDDLIQQTCLVCTQSLHRLADQAKFRSFLLGIARNVLHETTRRHREHKLTELQQEPATRDRSPSQVALLVQQRSQLAAALRSLPPEHEMAVVLHYWTGLSVAEIAQIQGVASGTVKSRLARGRARLRGDLALRHLRPNRGQL